ncbi:MAG: alpha-glucan family phosphorylase [Promethearchaeota archaeon]
MFELQKSDRIIAYFSMEIALESDIPTYSGGLGVLAGDTLRSAADLEIPAVAITLCYDKGYFFQEVIQGRQIEREIQWEFSSEFEKLPNIVELNIQDKKFKIGGWLYKIKGETGFEIPVILLDSNIEGNEHWQKNFTHILYDATPFQRVVQEMILGQGGMKMLEMLGYKNIQTYHMNEGHAAFGVFEQLEKFKGDLEEVRKRCIFTTHTPVPAGHDRFNYDLIRDIFRDRLPDNYQELGGKNELNMSLLALNGSRYCNGVAQKHAIVSRKMFPGYKIDGITNGIHNGFWINPHLRKLFDEKIPNWTMDYNLLQDVWDIGNYELWNKHMKAKLELMDYEKSHSWVLMDEKKLTIGFARRITEYKRPTLIFDDVERLGKICKKRVQFIFAGKSHPRDEQGKNFIKQISDMSDYLYDSYGIGLVFLGAYDMDLAKLLVSGVDVWLNNPRRYMEASGTSGMKATLNGVLNFSVLDGWWIEGYQKDPMAGWAIGPSPQDPKATEYPDSYDANDLYTKLEREIIPLYYNNRDGWAERMKHAIRLASFFNTHRMVEEYADRAWQLKVQPRWKSGLNY